MAHRLWLLVEWVDEKCLFSYYDVVNADSMVTSETDLRIGQLVFIRNNHDSGTRRAQILRMSDNKEYIKELKTLLERQDQQVKNVVKLCVNTIKEIKAGPLNLVDQCSSQQAVRSPGPSATPQRVCNASTYTGQFTDNDQEANELGFSNLTVQQKYQSKIAESSIAVYNNQHSSHQNFGRRRSMLSSTPLPARNIEEKPQPTCEQGTQTDDSMVPASLSKIQEIEDLLKGLYRQFIALVSQLDPEYAMAEMEDNSEFIEFMQDRAVNESANDKSVYQNVNVRDPASADRSMKTKIVQVRRASAHTTNGGTDMVPIGSGNVLVPTRLLKDMKWNSYTIATRQLLQAVFPRRVLATHSLSGKQSPAFTDKPPKKRLDPKIVDDIVETISDRCGVQKRLVRSIITTKCTDEAKLYRNRQNFKRMRETDQNEENRPPSSASSNSS